MDIIASEPDGRTIHWFVDKIGNSGKSSLATHITDTRPDALDCDGKFCDVKYYIYNWLQENNNRLKVALFDFTRGREAYISYDGIEAILNGKFLSTKFKVRKARFRPPHVLVFSNWRPDLSQSSADRWRIYNIIDREIDNIEGNTDKEPTHLAETPAGPVVNPEKEEEEDTPPQETPSSDYMDDDTLQRLLDGDYDYS